MKNLLLSVSCLFILSAATAQCSMVEVPLTERTNNATLVVEGKVISQNSYWNTNHTMIYTSNDVEVYKVFKGAVTGSTVTIITIGGTVGMDRITTDALLTLKMNDLGVFTLSPVTTMHNLPAGPLVQQYECYASAQGFVKYDLNTLTARDPFHTYPDIETDLYPAVTAPDRRTYVEVLPYNIHSANHSGNPTIQASITSFSPTTTTAGTASVLTINGSGFGATQGSGTVGFKNADDGGATFINPLPSQYISWSNTQIQVQVPQNAGTGTIQVTQGTTATSASTLTISWANLNVEFDPGSGTQAYQPDHINDNGTGGYTWQMNANVDGNVTERAAFMRAFDNWRCTTGINWVIGANTSVNDAVSDGTNVICNDNAAPLSAGILGVCYSYWSGCASGPTIIWYVNELDIIFDEGSNISPLTWQYGPATPTGSQYDFESVCVHELGHGHQHGHVINNGQIMHYALTNGTFNRTLSANDIAGANNVQSRSIVANVCGPGAMTNYSCAAPPVAAFTGTPTSLCEGGTVTYTDQSTNTPTSWSWIFQGGTPATSTAQNPTVTYATAGTYSVSLTATNASGSDNQSNAGYITVFQNPNLTASSQTNISCNGGANGGATVGISGGTPAYSYNWTPGNPTGDGTVTVSNLTAGTWTCTVTDSHSCTDNQTFTITQPSAISLTANSQTNTSCNGGSDGAASVNAATGGAGGYTYNWTPGNPTGDGTVSVTGLTAGTWTCTVTDANSCSTTRTFNITQPSAISVTPSQTNISCFNGSNGTATVVASGGTPGYTYSWAPSGGSAATASGLAVGSYTCTITDANSCSTTQSFTITQPPNLTSTRTSTPVSCFGGSDGTATVNPSGGTPAYTYSWAPLGGNAATATGLPNGSYTCTITDANGCSITRFTFVSAPGPILSAPTQTDLTCFGSNDGTAAVNASGGTPGYTYVWAPSGGTGATASGLAAGNYTCTITDTHTCSATQTFTITEPQQISIFMSETDENCASNDGTATASPTFGVGSYFYVWAPGGQTTQTAVNLAGGTYTCTVTDDNGCSNSNTVVVNTIGCSQPPVANFSGSPTTVCAGGSVSFTDLSTNSPTSWSWTFTGGSPSGSNAQNPTVVYNTPGTYAVSLMATNATGNNTMTMNGYITVNALPTISVVSNPLSGTVCSGSSATLTASGANSYSWTGGITNAVPFTPVATTTYTVTGTDVNGCQNTASSAITVNATPTLTITSNPVNGTVCNGNQATLTASGANTYSWTGGISNGVPFTPSSTNTYTVTGTGANGCQANASATITVNICSAVTTTVPCGNTFTMKSQTVSAANIPSAVSYRFSFYNSSTNALITQYTQASRTLTLNSVPGLYYNTTYKWTVAVNVGSGFGPESNLNCLITLAPAQTSVPCGNSYNSISTYSAVTAPLGINNYKFSFYNSSTNALITSVTQTSNYIYFNQVPGIGYGNTYKWTVAVEYPLASGGTAWGPESNMNCLITFNAPQTTVPCGRVYRLTQYTTCTPVGAAVGYRFSFYSGSTLVGQRSQSSTYIYFSQVGGLQNYVPYTWTVEVLYNNGSGNVYGPASASSCTISFNPTAISTNNSQQPYRMGDDSLMTPVEATSYLKVFPNPTSDKVSIETDETVISLSVYSISGDLIRKEGEVYETSLADLEAGTYLIIVETASGLKRSLVVKQ